MSALRDDRAIPADRVHRPTSGRPSIDVPGLEQPAHFVTAALSEGNYGHRAVLVIASEDGTTVTGAQLGELADALESLYGGEAAEGSRAWLRAKVAQWQEAAGRVNADAVAALQELTDLRHAIDTDGPMPRGVIADTVHNLRGRAEAAEQALQATRQRLHEVRVAAITGRDGALTDALDQASRLRRELELARARATEADDDAGRYARALTDLEQDRDGLRALVDQLRHERDGAREALRAEQERVAHERSARRAVTEMWQADAEFHHELAQAATQAARRRSTAAAALGVLAGAASALTWRFRR